MEKDDTIKKLTKEVETASTDFEKTNTELKRKYLLWNIEAFNLIASAGSVSKGTFGTGYPFYALDSNLEGELPIIQEQIRYNRELLKDGEPYQKSIWTCKSCLEKNYEQMPDLKKICRPCPNMANKLKPRKIINRLPDLDMWLVCEDGCVERAQKELSILLEKYNMRTSDVDPLLSVEEIKQIAKKLKHGDAPDIFLPIDAHIIEYSKLKDLINQVPEILQDAKQQEIKPYLPIQPKSYRKQWQYDDEAYNYIYDYLSAFTEFNFPRELQQALDNSRLEVVSQNTPQELVEFLMQSANDSNYRRFQTVQLESIFLSKVEGWKKNIEKNHRNSESKGNLTRKDICIEIDDEPEI